MRGRPLLFLTLFLLFAIASPAMAGGRLLTIASFTARVSGTYTSTGTVTNTQCQRLDAQDNPVNYTATGTATESTTFKATKGARFDVTKTKGQSGLRAGGFPIPVSASMKRATTLDESTEPKGCKLRRLPLPPNCGTKRKPYKLNVFGLRGGGFSYNFSSRFSTITPEDPFTCPLAEGGDWWARVRAITAKVSAAKLFNRGVKTIVAKASVTKSPKRSSTGQGYSTSTTETLRWTLTLTRRG
jgi:hypothetical protein